MIRWLVVVVLVVAVVVGGTLAWRLLGFIDPATRTDTWTFAFYLDGNNNLSRQQLQNLRELIAGQPGLEGVNIVVAIDIGRGRSRLLLRPFSGRRVFEIDGRSYHETVSSSLSVELPDVGTHDPERMRAFFAFVRERYPATHHAVVFTGHGYGPFGADLELPSEYGRPFTAEAMREGLRDHRVDLLVLDMCLMADTAGIATLKDRTDFLVVQQGRYPSGAQDYTLLLQNLSELEERSPAAVAEVAFTSAATALRRGHPLGATALLRTGPELDAMLERVDTHLSDPTHRAAVLEDDLHRLGSFGVPFRSMVDIAAVVAHINASDDRPPLELDRVILRLASKREAMHGLSVFLPDER